MRLPIAGLTVLAAAAAVQAAGREPEVRYVPEIFGRLAGVRGYRPTNVCLRHTGSEITQCAYTDSEGRFRLPSFGEVHPERASVAGKDVESYPDYWLEVGTRSDLVTRFQAIELVRRKNVAIHLECDLARGASLAKCERRDPR
jgi:hypothetical protein